MDILNYHVKVLEDNKFKVEKKSVDWNIIFKNKQKFYSEISSILLDEKSLYYFVSNNNDAKYLQEALTLKQKDKIKFVFEELIKKPEEFYSNYQKEQELLQELNLINDYMELNKFIKKYGIKKPKKNIELKKAKIYIKQSIKRESVYGVFGEIMLYVVIEKLIGNRNIIISKLSYVTAPGTYSHGSDGIFIDKINQILYFGEAKFTIDITSALEQALTSFKNIHKRIELDENFLLLHESSYKNGYSIEIFDEEKIKNFNKCVIVFAFHGEEYTDKEIKKFFDKYIVKFNDILNSKASVELISFPIISKEELKNEISRQVTIHYDNS